MTAFDQDLRGQVVWGTTERESLAVAFKNLGKAEVSKTDVAIFVHQDVLWLQVSVDDILRVQMTQSHGHLNGVETGSLLWEPGYLSQVHEQFTATDESHDEENLVVSLEHVAHAHQEWMVSLEQNIFLELR